jgi:hypothetical protein
MAAVQLETRRALRASNCTSVQRRDAAASIPEFAAVRQLPVRSLDLDELTATVTISDQGVHLAGQQVDAGKQADRAVALVFLVACEGQ